MRIKLFSIYIVIFTIIVPQHANGLSFKKISSAFGGKPFQETIEKEYQLNGQQKLVIDNLYGNITIKTEWQNNSVALKATIHKAKQEEDSVHIIDDISNPLEFALRTIASTEKCKSTIDYELIVPKNIKLQLSTNKGNISVTDVQGITMATTDKGSINFSNISNKARATTRNSGSIYCDDCSGELYATAKRGNIKMTNIMNTVVAKTDVGRINIHCKDLPTAGQIDVSSIWGNINIALPEESNANIKAFTQKGTCVCEHYITLKPQTTQLNTAAWTQFKRSVDGTIGDGTIPIQISSVSSNIRIMASKTS